MMKLHILRALGTSNWLTMASPMIVKPGMCCDSMTTDSIHEAISARSHMP